MWPALGTIRSTTSSPRLPAVWAYSELAAGGTMRSRSPWTTSCGTPSGRRSNGEAARFRAGCRWGVPPRRASTASDPTPCSKAACRSVTAARAATLPTAGCPPDERARSPASQSASCPPAEWPATATEVTSSRRPSGSTASASNPFRTSSRVPGHPPPGSPTLRYSRFQTAIPRLTRSCAAADIRSSPHGRFQNPPWSRTATGYGGLPAGRARTPNWEGAGPYMRRTARVE